MQKTKHSLQIRFIIEIHNELMFKQCVNPCDREKLKGNDEQ